MIVVMWVLLGTMLGFIAYKAVPENPESRKRLVQTTRWLGRWLGEQIIELVDSAVGWVIVGAFLTIIVTALTILFIPALIVFLIYWLTPEDQVHATPLPEVPGNTLFDDVYNINRNG